MPARVVVVGSYNQDMVWRTARFPVPGETRLGTFDTGPGGKGFNQAIACARQGVATHFIGALGDDAIARGMRELALSEGLALHCETHAQLATGTAAILVEDSGQNLIVVGPGANAALSVAHITAQAAVPQALVSPAPRSHTLIVARSLASIRASVMLARCGNSGWCSSIGPTLARSTTSRSVTQKMQCGLPTFTTDGEWMSGASMGPTASSI